MSAGILSQRETGPSLLKESPQKPRLVLIEGLPGSGKSCTAEWMAAWLGREALTARWVGEIDREHPVIDGEVRKKSHEPGYADVCIGRWRSYAKKAAELSRTHIDVLEGCFFQSTVRLMLERDHPREDVVSYQRESEAALACLSPWLVVLSPRDPEVYLREHIVERKGCGIVDRIIAHTETTPIARRMGWSGFDGFVAFYAHYHRTCDELISKSRLPILLFDSLRQSKKTIRRAIQAEWARPGSQCVSYPGAA